MSDSCGTNNFSVAEGVSDKPVGLSGSKGWILGSGGGGGKGGGDGEFADAHMSGSLRTGSSAACVICDWK